ncbi:hypothetical protein NC652_004913 [Populus alba x Populus x berolinensis]|nr:hypothetical protein NC652_004913 [Populus alba x Populus x berolinensis]
MGVSELLFLLECRQIKLEGLALRCFSGIYAEWKDGLLLILRQYHLNAGIRKTAPCWSWAYGEGLPSCYKHSRQSLDIRLSHRRYNGVKVTVEDGSTFMADAAVVAVLLRHLMAAATSEFHKATGHPVLVYMPAGKLARDIEKMLMKAAANFAFTQLKKILPDASAPIKYLVSRWGSDINSLGSYSYDTVGKSHDLYERLRIPIDNLFFAGEATSISYQGQCMVRSRLD